MTNVRDRAWPRSIKRIMTRDPAENLFKYFSNSIMGLSTGNLKALNGVESNPKITDEEI